MNHQMVDLLRPRLHTFSYHWPHWHHQPPSSYFVAFSPLGLMPHFQLIRVIEEEESPTSWFINRVTPNLFWCVKSVEGGERFLSSFRTFLSMWVDDFKFLNSRPIIFRNLSSSASIIYFFSFFFHFSLNNHQTRAEIILFIGPSSSSFIPLSVDEKETHVDGYRAPTEKNPSSEIKTWNKSGKLT